MKKLFNLVCFAVIAGCLGITGTYVTMDYSPGVEAGAAQSASQVDDDGLQEETAQNEAEKAGEAAQNEGIEGAASSGSAAQSTAAQVSAPQISASGAILIDGESGEVLYELDADRQLMPASTTKIMTALVVLEICDELDVGLDSEVVVPQEAEGVEGSSMYLKGGEKVTIERLLYGLMLQSGNDAAKTLAICMGGTEEKFVERMNVTAADIGCSGTNFVNPHGLSDENHYTTARDLALIAQEVMKREDFRQIVGVQQWEDIYNKNKTVHQYEGGNGVKIGYTQASGRTLVASAERDGKTLIAVVLNDGNWFNDAYSLLDYGFARKEQ